MTNWIRYEHEGVTGFGTLEGDRVQPFAGDLFGECQPMGRPLALAAVRLLMPVVPGKMLGLWNNFHERAKKENLHQPEHPLYFVKTNNCYAGPEDVIRRPPGYAGAVVFEGELGIVIGRRCANADEAEAERCIFGYTCVNDVTASMLLRVDPAFVHWTRAKSFDTFGVLGPVIATGLTPNSLRVHTLLNGEEKQNYPVSDMFFGPHRIVSRISQDLTLEPGDVIASGTSVGNQAMAAGDRVEVVIDGIGSLGNTFQ